MTEIDSEEVKDRIYEMAKEFNDRGIDEMRELFSDPVLPPDQMLTDDYLSGYRSGIWIGMNSAMDIVDEMEND